MQATRPSILFIHNTYLHKGGEDNVVMQEMDVLKKNGYTVFYREYHNETGRPVTGMVTMAASLFFNISAFFSTFLLVKKHRIQVVHVHNLFYRASPSVLWAAKLAGARTIMTLHNYRLFCLNALLFRDGHICMVCHENRNFSMGIGEKCFKSSRTFSRALAWSTYLHRSAGTWRNQVDRFVVINPLMKGLLADVDVKPGNISVKPNFIADSGYRNYDERKGFYLFAGRLQEEKGVRCLIDAFQQSGRELVIAGDGDLLPLVQSACVQAGGSNIRYAGFLSRAELLKLLLDCRAFIFPSLWPEGMPLTLIEAQCTGTIPIAAGTPNIRQIISDKENGLLFEPGSSASLNAAVGRFEALDHEQLNRMSASARRHFLEHYSEQMHFQAIQSIYSS